MGTGFLLGGQKLCAPPLPTGAPKKPALDRVKMPFRIVCTTELERDELRLRIGEAQVIRAMKPVIYRRLEETGIDFLA